MFFITIVSTDFSFCLFFWYDNTVYSDGKVCISILHPPGDDPNGYECANERWSPVHTVLLYHKCHCEMWTAEFLSFFLFFLTSHQLHGGRFFLIFSFCLLQKNLKSVGVNVSPRFGYCFLFLFQISRSSEFTKMNKKTK